MATWGNEGNFKMEPKTDDKTHDAHYVHIAISEHASTAIDASVRLKIIDFMQKANAVNPRKSGKLSYQFWKVPETFSMSEFQKMVESLPTGVKIEIVKIVNNTHTNYIFEGLQEKKIKDPEKEIKDQEEKVAKLTIQSSDKHP